MDLALTEEQEAVVALAEQILTGELSGERRRAVEDGETGVDEALWQTFAEAGLLALCLPESAGGSGYGPVEAALLLQELGRAPALVPLHPTLMAGILIAEHASSEQAAALLAGVAEGDRTFALALADEPRAPLRRPAVTYDSSGLHGTKTAVGFAPTADVLLVTAADGVYAVETGAAGVTIEPQLLQHRVRAGRVTFAGAPAERVAGPEGVTRLVDLATLGICAIVTGACDAALRLTAEYAGQRHQFGRPIGSFQAIKHKCADMLLETESAKSAAYYAGWCAAELNDELPTVASLAKAYCSEAYFHTSAENIQIHGGIGFTWEHPAHLYFKRAKSSELLFGDPSYHRELLAQRLGI